MTNDYEPVSFISVESGRDLILSFYVVSPDDPMEGRSVILMRNLKWEALLPDSERGVKVSDEELFGEEEREDNYLEGIRLGNSTAEIISTFYCRKLDLSRVETSELRAAKKILKKMNYDKRFKLELS